MAGGPRLVADLTVYQNVDKTFGPITFASADPSGEGDLAKQVYDNFAGATVKMQIRQQQDASSAALLTLFPSLTSAQAQGGPPDPGIGAPNAITWAMTAAQNASLAVGVYFYDIILTLAGANQCLMAGLFNVQSTVTR